MIMLSIIGQWVLMHPRLTFTITLIAMLLIYSVIISFITALSKRRPFYDNNETCRKKTFNLEDAKDQIESDKIL